jgi:hypothetical protein
MSAESKPDPDFIDPANGLPITQFITLPTCPNCGGVYNMRNNGCLYSVDAAGMIRCSACFHLAHGSEWLAKGTLNE